MTDKIENCKWYWYKQERIFVQKLLGEWHYWDSNGWHILTEMIKTFMVLDSNQK